MPASRRTSASSHDEDLADHLHGLSIAGGRGSARGSPVPPTVSQSILGGRARFGDDDAVTYGGAYNAGMLLDEQLDKEMHSKWHPHLAGIFSYFRCDEELAYF